MTTGHTTPLHAADGTQDGLTVEDVSAHAAFQSLDRVRGARQAPDPALLEVLTLTIPTGEPAADGWAQWPAGAGSYTSLTTGRPTEKWRGVSLTRVRGAVSGVQSAEQELRAAARRLAEAEAVRQAAVEDLLGVRVVLGDRECEDSPTRACVFPVLDEEKVAAAVARSDPDEENHLTEDEERALYASDEDEHVLDEPGAPACLFCRRP